MSTPATEQSQSEEESAGLRERLASRLNPVEAVLLTRGRLQEVLDDAVRRGRMTRQDATELVQELVTRSRSSTESVLSDVDQLLGGSAEKVRKGVKRATGIGGTGEDFPIADYDSLTAAQITQRLGDLDATALSRVREHEQRNGNRKTVLGAIESKLP